MGQDNGYNEDRNLVRHELARLAESHEALIQTINGYEMRNLEAHAKLGAEIAALKVKASMWGAVAGAIMACMIILAGWIGSQSRSGDDKEKTEYRQPAGTRP